MCIQANGCFSILFVDALASAHSFNCPLLLYKILMPRLLSFLFIFAVVYSCLIVLFTLPLLLDAVKSCSAFFSLSKFLSFCFGHFYWPCFASAGVWFSRLFCSIPTPFPVPLWAEGFLSQEIAHHYIQCFAALPACTRRMSVPNNCHLLDTSEGSRQSRWKSRRGCWPYRPCTLNFKTDVLLLLSADETGYRRKLAALLLVW